MCGPEASLRNGSNHAECDSVHAGGGSKNFLGGGGKSSNDISADDVAPGAQRMKTQSASLTLTPARRPPRRCA